MYNPKSKEYERLNMKTTNTFIPNPKKKYPFMDTMEWFYVEKGFLSNTRKYYDSENEEDVYHLKSTLGDFVVIDKGIYVDYYDDYMDPDDLLWCE